MSKLEELKALQKQLTHQLHIIEKRMGNEKSATEIEAYAKEAAAVRERIEALREKSIDPSVIGSGLGRGGVIYLWLIIILLLSLFAITSNMLIDPGLYKVTFNFGLCTSVLLSVIFLFCTFKRSYNANIEWIKKSFLERVKIVLGGIFIIPILITPAVANGIPSVLHFLGSTRGAIEVTVESKGYGGGYKSFARYGTYIYIKEFKTNFLSPRIAVKEYHWEKISPGDKIILHGSRSYWGFNYD